MDRPVVGVVGSRYVVPRFWGELPVVGTPTSYVDAVLAAGGMPILLVDRCATAALDIVDALILTGGGDVDPALYDGDPATGRDVDPARDRAEIDLVLAAATGGIPLLGVCRGIPEAIEPTTAWPALGVQWHPELDGTALPLFSWLLDRTRLRVR